MLVVRLWCACVLFLCGLRPPSKRFVLLPFVRACLEILTTLTFGALRKKIAKKKNTKKKNNETSSSTCCQQCIMNRHEHNRSLERDVAWKKNSSSDVHGGLHKKKTISVIVDKVTPQGIYVHHLLSINSKITTSCVNYDYYGFN